MTNKSNLAPIYESESFTERFEYSEAIRLTEMKIRKLLRTAPLLVRRQMSHLAEATGKGIRAQALLACAMGSDGLVGHDAINAAVAVEMLHLATLIHDDIIDNADIRRGITALHMKFALRLTLFLPYHLRKRVGMKWVGYYHHTLRRFALVRSEN